MSRAARILYSVAAASFAAQLSFAAPAVPQKAPTPKERLNCNDPAVTADDAWSPDKEQLQALGKQLSKVYPVVASKAGIPKTNYGMLYCGIRENGVAVIVANGVRKYHAKYVCDDDANFAVTFDPDKQTFGTFHFAAKLCPPGK